MSSGAAHVVLHDNSDLVAERLLKVVTQVIVDLSTADQNRVLLKLREFAAMHLEALEDTSRQEET
jgi:hypothetical protein